MRIGFIGFGSVTGAFMLGLRSVGVDPMAFYKHGPRPPYRGQAAERLAETGAIFCEPAELAARCDVLFSCVVGSAVLEVAAQFAPFMTSKHLYVDLATADPQTKCAAADAVEATGAAYVDGAIMGAVELMRHRVPIDASGHGASRFAELFTPLGMDITVLGDAPGQAASIKLLRSVFQKGLAALLIETSLAARKMDVQQAVLNSLFATFARTPFPQLADTLVSKALQHAGRMSREMATVRHFLQSEGQRDAMTAGTQATYDWCASLDLDTLLEGRFPATLDESVSVLAQCAAIGQNSFQNQD